MKKKIATYHEQNVDDLILRADTTLMWRFCGGYVELDANGTPMSWNYYITDHLGSTRAVVDSNNSIRETVSYYPFGGIIADISFDQDVQSHRYNGKEFDKMHGLNTYDYGARQYNPVTARWDRMNPLAEKYYSMSPYNYCGGNPVNLIDPDGMRIYVEEESREQVLEWINALSKDQYKIDDSGFLYLAGSTSEKYHSQYYSDRLNAAISSDNTINIHIGNSLKGRSLSDIGEGATWCCPILKMWLYFERP